MPRFTRRQTLAIGAGAGLSVTINRRLRAATAPSAAPTFTLLLVNDIYNEASVGGRGGFAKLAAVVAAERARGVPMLFCHAGDTFSPSLQSGLDKGANIVALTNLVAPDIFVPGNHEFDFGPEVFSQRMQDSKFPYFAANLRRADGSQIPGMRDSTIVKLGPLNVGVIGLALADTPRVSQSGNLKFSSEMDRLRQEAPKLRRQGADFLVCVSHTPRSIDYEIVRSGLVDVLLSGHDHDLAIEYAGRAVLVESSEDAHYVTAVDITAKIEADGDRRRVRWEPSFRIHDTTSVEPDPAVQAVVSRMEGELSRELDVVIGTTATELDTRFVVVRSREAAIGNLVADVLRTATGADVALVNGGGLRGDRIYRADSSLNRRNILTILPFGNTTVMVRIIGAELRAALENGVSQIERPTARFPQVSGLRFVYNPQAPVGSRVRTVTVGGALLDLTKTYTVAANDYLLAGGDGYSMLAKGKVLIGGTDGKLMANEVMAYVRKRGTIDPKVEGRIATV